MTFSLRARILLFVMALAIIPAIVISVWLQRSALRSGEELLRIRLAEQLEETAIAVARRWAEHRSVLLDLATPTDNIATAMVRLDSAVRNRPLSDEIDQVELKDAAGATRWSYSPSGLAHAIPNAAVPILLPLASASDGATHPTLEVWWRLQPALAGSGLSTAAPGAVLSVLERRSHTALLALPFDVQVLEQDTFTWGGNPWIVQRRPMDDPRMDLIAAAPLTPLTLPLRAAARRSTIVLLAIAAAAALIGYALSLRLTRPLSQLAAAARAVAQGDLDHRVALQRKDELGAVALAFNRMTENLQESLAQRAKKEALAAVGEFATELAHEVRNPLSSLRLDLQYVHERLAGDSPLRQVQTAALDTIARLDVTVSTALTAARSDRISIAPLDLREPMVAAARSAAPVFSAREAALDLSIDDGPLIVAGDGAALEQLVLNLLVNAADALPIGGRARLEARRTGEQIEVRVSDNGVGMPAGVLRRAFDAHFSTKRTGTGLGLAISRRIAHAHHGELSVESEPGVGTTFTLRVPACIEAMQPAT